MPPTSPRRLGRECARAAKHQQRRNRKPRARVDSITMATDTEAQAKRPKKTETAKVAKAYFDAINAHDIEAAAACWADDAEDVLHGQRTFVGPDGIREFLRELFGAIPDARLDVHASTTEAERCVLRYTLRGTL